MSSPPVAVLPDLSGAIRAYLRSIPAITALVGDRVWIGWPRDPDGSLRVKVPPYLHAILIESGRGGFLDPGVPYLSERVDLSCLGPSDAEAALLWRTMAAYLLDVERRRPTAFRAANTLVDGILYEAGPFRSPDPPTGWPRTWATFTFRYCGVPLSELVR